MQRHVSTGHLVYSFVLCFACHAISLSGALAEEQTWYYLSNDGDATLLMKVPDYYAVPDTSQHIGIVPHKTEVEILESRADRALSILKWSKVRILAGQFKDQTGWVSANCVVKTNEPRPRIPRVNEAEQIAEQRMERSWMDDGTRIRAIVSSATQLREEPNALDSDVAAPILEPETLLQRISPDVVKQNVGINVSWIRVRVLTGDARGKEGWVLRHQVREFRRLLYFAIYYRVADRAFETAANTAMDEFAATLGSGDVTNSTPVEGPAVADVEYERMMIGVRSKTDFLDAWKEIYDHAQSESLEVYYGALFVHASIQDNARDGLEFGNAGDATVRPGEIARLQKLPWSPDAKGLYLHACWSGSYEGKFSGLLAQRNWCPAEILAKKQQVTTWGQQGAAYFSSDPAIYVETKPTNKKIYLYSYRRGQNVFLLGDGTRIPDVRFEP